MTESEAIIFIAETMSLENQAYWFLKGFSWAFASVVPIIGTRLIRKMSPNQRRVDGI